MLTDRVNVLFVDHTRIVVRGGKGATAHVFPPGEVCPLGRPGWRKWPAAAGSDPRLGPQKKSLLASLPDPISMLWKAIRRRREPVRPGRRRLEVFVPTGTLVYREGKLLADLKVPGERVLCGPRRPGRARQSAFKDPTHHRASHLEKGERAKIHPRSRTKILADIVWSAVPTPGSPRSSQRLTAARPKIADYPFTTLNPTWVSPCGMACRCMADLPGLIEGAHAGKALAFIFCATSNAPRDLSTWSICPA